MYNLGVGSSSKEILSTTDFFLIVYDLGFTLISFCICTVETGPEDTKIVLESFLMIVKQNDSYFHGTQADCLGYQRFQDSIQLTNLPMSQFFIENVITFAYNIHTSS